MSAEAVWGSFALLRPWWLLALLPVALLSWKALGDQRRGDGPWRRVIDAHLRDSVLIQSPVLSVSPVLILAALVLAVIGLAGPARIHGKSDLAYRSSAARVLVVDLSPAMDAPDWAPSRSERVRLKLLELLQAMPDGQTALLVYSAEPYLVAPLTSDVATISLLVPELGSAVMPVAGNEPILALRMALGILSRSGASSRDLVWITGLPDAPPDFFRPLRDHGGTRISILHASPQRANGLRKLAEASGGTYASLSSDNIDVQALALQLGGQKTWVPERRQNAGGVEDLGPWLLALLVPLAALAFRRGFLLGFLVCFLSGFGLAPPSVAVESPARFGADLIAYRLLTQGDPSGAARQFADPRWRAVAWYRAGDYAAAAKLLAALSDADAHYNRGNALAKLGDLPGALAAFEQALALRPNAPDILHNRDLIQDLLNQQDPPKSGRSPPPPPAAAKSGLPSGDRAGLVAPPAASDREREADSLADQLMRRTPDEPAGLLKRKLSLEHQRRQKSTGGKAWD